MPNKKTKTTHKKTRKTPSSQVLKKEKKKTISKKERTEIKKAAQAIPSLIVEHLNFQDAEASLENKQEKVGELYDYARDNGKKKIMVWLGVGTIMMIVFAMWILSLKTNLYDLKKSDSLEGNLLGSAKNDLGELMAGFGTENSTNKNSTNNTNKDQKEIEETLKQNLAGILAQIASSTSENVSSTIFVTSTISSTTPSL